MRIASILALPFASLRLLHPVSATSIPYTPSHVFLSPLQNSSLAYLLLDGQDQTTTTFLSLNISQEVNAGNPSYTTLLDQAPFREDDYTAAFVPVIDDHGIIKVYTGNCQNFPAPSAVWQFTPDPDSAIGNGTWEKLSVDKKNEDVQGPNYLAAGFSYTITDTEDSAVYTFGGMCPWNNNTNASWIAAANYSQDMAVLDPSTDSKIPYLFETAGKRAPPIAEAGLSITPLLPAYSTSANGKMLRQQDFLFIGGQTQQAFLNMSELAVYSLPHDSWSFVAIESDPPSAKTELAVRDTKSIVEPRSGHTAVLSPDGNKVIVVGGWVGNTGVPANPQLAILELGSAYKGYGSWTWKVPSLEDSFLADGTGIYGHGTAMLPGGVMMIAGGYCISQSSKRSTNSQIYFYNVTSNTWASSYTNPNWQAANSTSQSHSGSLSKAAKVGIGVGVPVGMLALGAMGFFAWWYSRRFRWRRKRNSELRELALGAQRSHFWGRDEPEMASSIHRPSLGSDRTSSWASNKGNGKSKPVENGDASLAERTGLLMDGLSSMKNNRQKNKPTYRTGNNPAGDIHPIDEREEYEASASDNLLTRDTNPPPLRRGLLEGIAIPDPRISAPFLMPRSNNFDRAQENDRAALEESAFLTRFDDASSGTPASSTKDRPHSSQSNSPKMMRLGMVPRSRATLSYNPTSIPNNGQFPNTTAVVSTPSKETASSSSDKRYSTDSFSTAYTSQSQKQAEGERLLREQEGPEDVAAPAPEPELTTPLELPAKVAATSSRPKGPKASEWIGSVRRVLSGSRKLIIPDKSSADEKTPTTPLASGIDRRKTVLESRNVSFQDEDRDFALPRRTVSASAELFRRKQGAKDWDASPTSRKSHDGGAESDAMLDTSHKENVQSDEEDWDIETAAEGRRVQVTFTVPKERLRVVNGAPNDLESVSTASRVNSGGTGTSSYRTVSK